MEWQPIETAPRDGTRILLKEVSFSWNSDICQNVAIGHNAIEGYWGKGIENKYGWRKWCGNEKTHSTHTPLPIKWCVLPEDPKDAQ